ncbi:hypothetical protein BDZ97DRAFT_1809335 [Flammula alnicola]|nr:hypothetical protein BDZ97DRAFT_1809335 [Flammula alnicola]
MGTLMCCSTTLDISVEEFESTWITGQRFSVNAGSSYLVCCRTMTGSRLKHWLIWYSSLTQLCLPHTLENKYGRTVSYSARASLLELEV